MNPGMEAVLMVLSQPSDEAGPHTLPVPNCFVCEVPMVLSGGDYVCLSCGASSSGPTADDDAVQMMVHDGQAPTAPLDEFITAYEDDPNLWWRIPCGHHQNLFEAAVERIEELQQKETE